MLGFFKSLLGKGGAKTAGASGLEQYAAKQQAAIRQADQLGMDDLTESLLKSNQSLLKQSGLYAGADPVKAGARVGASNSAATAAGICNWRNK